MEASTDRKYLFGGPDLWPVDPSSEDSQCPSFRAIDDRVRGGSSISHLTVLASGHTASFNGTLDTKTLGGAGFASQCTLDGPTWDLSAYEGLEVIVGEELGKMGSGERYVLLVKDTLEGDRGDLREKSGVSWEYIFDAHAGQAIRAKWCDFKPTYRGREIDVPEGGLKTGEIKRIGFMMRSFFDAQSGPFNLPVRSVAAFKHSPHHNELTKHTTHHSTSSSATKVASHSPSYLGQKRTGEEQEILMGKTEEQIGISSDQFIEQRGADGSTHEKLMNMSQKELDAYHKTQKKEKKEAYRAEEKAAKAEREKEMDARTGIGALTGEMRDRGEGGQPGWRGWLNFLGRGCF